MTKMSPKRRQNSSHSNHQNIMLSNALYVLGFFAGLIYFIPKGVKDESKHVSFMNLRFFSVNPGIE